VFFEFIIPVVGVVIVINFHHVPDGLAMPLDPNMLESWCLVNHCELENHE
jgi:hypothetical protein